MKQKKALLALLPFAILCMGVWLSDQSPAYVHLDNGVSGTPFRVLAELEGSAEGLGADLVCVQDTVKHHAEQALKSGLNARSSKMALELCCAPDSPMDYATDTQFRLQMDFIHYGVDASLNELTASLRESGLQLHNLRQVGNEVHGDLAGLMESPEDSDKKVRLEEVTLRLKAFSLTDFKGTPA